MKWLKRLFAGPTQKIDEPEPPEPPDAVGCAAGSHAAYQGQDLLLRQDSPEFDLFVACSELDSGKDLAHGAHHLANLLHVDPARADWRELADRYLPAQGRALEAPGAKRFAATEAWRAYVLQAQGRTAEAVSLLLDVTQAVGDCRYLHAWALDWIEPAGALEALPESTAVKLFAAILSMHGEARFASASTRASMARWVVLIERVAHRYAQTPVLILTRAGLQRKVGAFDRALAIAGAIEAAASFNQAVAVGLAHRLKRQFAESEAAFVKALTFEPANISGMLEAGDTCFEAGDWHKALAWYEVALAQQHDHPWALASVLYCRFKIDEHDACMEELVALAHGGNQRAHQLWFAEAGAVKESGDASANFLRQLRDNWTQQRAPRASGTIKLGVSTLEAPSVRLAFGLEMAALDVEGELIIDVASVPARDPRIAVAEVCYTLWHYDGTTPRPGLPVPSAMVALALAALAAQPYDPWLNWTDASHVALTLGPAQIQDILAVMVHPPPVPAGHHALAWLARIQLAAAQVAAQVDGGWEGSVRQKALLSLLYGPWDWTTGAAIKVMAWIGRNEPAYALAIHRAFQVLEPFAPTEGHWDWVQELYEQWPTLPFLSDSEREHCQRELEALA